MTLLLNSRSNSNLTGPNQDASRARLAFSPDYRGNPYQQMVYSELHEPIEPVDAPDVPARLGPGSGIECFHQHWLKEIYGNCSADEAGYEKVNQYFASLRAFQQRGGRVIWTVHNLLEHDLDASMQELNLHCLREMLSIADRILIHTNSSVEELETLTGINVQQKSVTIPHPLYSHLEIMPDFLPIEVRVKTLDEGTRFLMFGMLRPYKGGSDLLETFLDQREQGLLPGATLTLAGKIYDPELQGLLASGRPGLKHVVVVNRRVSDSELATLCRWADVAVMPYRKIHISGSYYQAATFNLASIVPDLGMFSREVRHGDTGLVYQSKQLGEGLVAANALGKEELALMGQRVRAAHEHQSERKISLRLKDLIKTLRAEAAGEGEPEAGRKVDEPEHDGPLLSFCIPVMNRLSDIQATLRQNLEDNRNSRGRVEFIVVSFDHDDTTANWVNENFAEDLDSGYLRFYHRDDMPFWHFGWAKNAFKDLMRGRIYASLDGDNFTGPDGGEHIIKVFQAHNFRCVFHQFQGEWGDGTCGRISLAREDYSTYGYDDRFLPRQWDELDALLSALVQNPGHVYACYEGKSIIDKSHPFRRFLEENNAMPIVVKLAADSDPLLNATEVSAVGQHDNQYVENDATLRLSSVYNHLQSFFKNARSEERRVTYTLELVDAQRSLVEEVPEGKLETWVLEAQSALPEATTDHPVTLLACLKNERGLEEWYEHYRQLGVERFLLIDDGSDIPVSSILTQDHVHVWSPRVGQFRYAKAFWLEVLLNSYCDGSWCLTVDGDEFLSLPECPNCNGFDASEAEVGRPDSLLSRVISVAEDNSDTYFCGFMLDVVPAPQSGNAVTELERQAFTHFQYDETPPTQEYREHNTVRWSYGKLADWAHCIDVRYRINGSYDSLRKFPLFKFTPGTHLNQGFHDLIIDGQKRSPADLERADLLPLLHYKLWVMGENHLAQSAVDFASYHHETRKNLESLRDRFQEKLDAASADGMVYRYRSYDLMPVPAASFLSVNWTDWEAANYEDRLNRCAALGYSHREGPVEVHGDKLLGPDREAVERWVVQATPFVSIARKDEHETVFGTAVELSESRQNSGTRTRSEASL